MLQVQAPGCPAAVEEADAVRAPRASAADGRPAAAAAGTPASAAAGYGGARPELRAAGGSGP